MFVSELASCVAYQSVNRLGRILSDATIGIIAAPGA
jgi:hypothetical protein